MIIVALASMLVSTGAATATTANRCELSKGTALQNGVLSAWNQVECVNPEYIRALDVVLERWDENIHPEPDRWVIVAKGRGVVCYQCNGTSAEKYRLNGGAEEWFACG